MNCTGEWIEAYLDEELDPAARAEAGEHLASCPACAEAHARLRDQQHRIQAEAPYYAAPPGLEHAVREAIARASAPPREERRAPQFWRALAVAACLLLAVSIGWNVRQFRSRNAAADLLASDVLSSHIRSLIGAHLLDVPSSDQHTVKPWFNGKLDFSPTVKELAAQGFPLAGGRLDYLSGRTVAVLVYHRRLHVINLFIWPSNEAPPAETRFTRNGFQLVHWTDGSMAYWAVSDIPMTDLEQFEALVK